MGMSKVEKDRLGIEQSRWRMECWGEGEGQRWSQIREVCIHVNFFAWMSFSNMCTRIQILMHILMSLATKYPCMCLFHTDSESLHKRAILMYLEHLCTVLKEQTKKIQKRLIAHSVHCCHNLSDMQQLKKTKKNWTNLKFASATKIWKENTKTCLFFFVWMGKFLDQTWKYNIIMVKSKCHLFTC